MPRFCGRRGSRNQVEPANAIRAKLEKASKHNGKFSHSQKSADFWSLETESGKNLSDVKNIGRDIRVLIILAHKLNI